MTARITVWHAKKPTFNTETTAMFSQADYDLVATIDHPNATADLAYQLTNHIDEYWWDNDHVTLVGEADKRSTSVGDVLVVDGTIFQVANCGFDLLSAA